MSPDPTTTTVGTGPSGPAPRVLLSDPAGLFTTLARLALPPGSYVICGSAALYVRGLRAHLGDLDVLATGRAWDIVTRLGAPRPAPSGHGRLIDHPAAAIEFTDRWTPGWDTHHLIASADLIDGLPFMRLGDVLAWKQTARRPKDLPDIAAIHRLRQVWSGRPAAARTVPTVSSDKEPTMGMFFGRNTGSRSYTYTAELAGKLTRKGANTSTGAGHLLAYMSGTLGGDERTLCPEEAEQAARSIEQAAKKLSRGDRRIAEQIAADARAAADARRPWTIG
ncbi:hypothetical protein FHS43_000398 [Streptosporangium becharense]|uniref:DUF7739 domain-containing protein n=1 Tax=Streptosporangium becharense TaxID=1816182 RepID=A0A7W9IFM0_9ACTN|nr:hypothetical protein [Streptosporangium becharense]MBB2909152.1 hypothetical protein [Streptosporangium becharense]MBB5819829.1 hypothetical protein [Streptosporangium becharense]